MSLEYIDIFPTTPASLFYCRWKYGNIESCINDNTGTSSKYPTKFLERSGEQFLYLYT